MFVHVLGCAAGGGFPQWNCNCDNCVGVREGRFGLKARTQSSVAVSSDRKAWVLINASPDIRTQIEAFPALRPKRAIRDSAIAAIVLIDGQLEHCAGLLSLYQGGGLSAGETIIGPKLNVYCTDTLCEDLTVTLPILPVLERYCGVNRHRIDIDSGASWRIAQAEGLRFLAVPVKSRAPIYSPHRENPHRGDTIALWVEDERSGRSLLYAGALGETDPQLLGLMARADCLFVDGTFWSDQETAALGISPTLSRQRGHLPVSGAGGMIEILRPFKHCRKILTHINNTNPILNEASPERAQLVLEGIEVAYDGMEFEL